jgi:hypothetical protein
MNGSGQLSLVELVDGMKNLRVPWQQVTGLTRAKLFSLVDPTKSGRVDILEFLGKDSLTARRDWSELSPLEQWEEYANKVIDLDLTSMEYSVPLWSESGSELVQKLERLEEASRRKLNRILRSSISQDQRVFLDLVKSGSTCTMSREDLDYIQTRVVRIEKFLKDFNENKRDLVKIKLNLANVTESQERLAELKRKREEEEREKQRRKTEAGMALVSDGDSRISIFGNKSTVELGQFRDPREDELDKFFSLTNSSLVDQSELEFRQLLDKLGLTLVEGDKVRASFRRNSSKKSGEETLDFSEFASTMQDLQGTTALSRLSGYWPSLSVARGSVNLSEFLTWYSSFVPSSQA